MADDDWVPEFADDPSAYGTSTSWEKRGYRPLRGIATPDYERTSTGGISPLRCPGCQHWTMVIVKSPCRGGLLRCWLRLRQEEKRHEDRHCRECGHTWVVGTYG